MEPGKDPPPAQNYTTVKTEDCSYTVYSNEYGQAMHSVSGAYQESLLKHIVPSNILKHEGTVTGVLDVGFGIGYNVLALVTEMIKINPEKKMKIISFEKDLSHIHLMDRIKFNDIRDRHYAFIKKAVTDGTAQYRSITLDIMPGDARSSIQKISGIQFNALFHDPYSPAKNPELWTLEFFMKIFSLMTEEAILTTYSSAPQVRGALVEAGFHIAPGPSVGKKTQ